MTYAPTYNRLYNFTNYQTANPATPLPGAQVDAELSQIKVTLDAMLQNLALIQRNDGALGNSTVGPNQISTALTLGFTFRGTWAMATNYVANDGVFYGYKFYKALLSNLSAALTPDLDTTNWLMVADFTGSPIATAIAAANTATTQAGTATTQAGIATTQAGIATTQAGNALTSANNAAASQAAMAFVSGKNRILNGEHDFDSVNAGASGTAIAYATDQWKYASSLATKGTWGQNLNASSWLAALPFNNYLGFRSNNASRFFLFSGLGVLPPLLGLCFAILPMVSG